MNTRPIPTLKTECLILRPFTDADLPILAHAIFGDPAVMRYIPQSPLSPGERAARALRANERHWQEHGFGKWAVAPKSGGDTMGYCGLNCVDEAGAVEIEYGYAQPYWGKGFATEAARAALGFGLTEVKLPRVIGLVVPENIASRRVLEHLGLTYECDVHLWGLDLRQYQIRPDAAGGQAQKPPGPRF